MLVRDNRYVEPEKGWLFEGRQYMAQENISDEAIADEASNKEKGKNNSSLLHACF